MTVLMALLLLVHVQAVHVLDGVLDMLATLLDLKVAPMRQRDQSPMTLRDLRLHSDDCYCANHDRASCQTGHHCSTNTHAHSNQTLLNEKNEQMYCE